jgi:hypothetical protein
MPLMDHFHPPLYPRRQFDSFHGMWTACLTQTLNQRWLPPGYYADVQTHNGRVEIDVASYEELRGPTPAVSKNGGTATLLAPALSPPQPAVSFPVVFPRTFEVRVYSEGRGGILVAAIELVSAGNKDRPAERQAFVAKCAGYVSQGVSLIVVDVVTAYRSNLHNEFMKLLDAPAATLLPPESYLYAVAYRPTTRDDQAQLDLWPHQCALGEPLPTLPLRLTGDLFVQVDLEATYMETIARLRITLP